MTKVKPFCALTYNQEKIGDLSKVVCPPYDVISSQAQDYYHNLNNYNLIHILLGKDSAEEDKYERSGRLFRQWLKEEVLIRDKQPAIYFYNQEYYLKGERKARLGFIALLRLADERSKIFAHEHTRLEPKEDRLQLIRQVKANLSPIFVLFADKGRIIQRIYEKDIQGEAPFIDTADEDNGRHRVWRINSEEIISRITSGLSDKNIFIADGHHRYEVAERYREELGLALGGVEPEDDANYIMSYFTNVESKGLAILPVHRIVRLEADFNMSRFIGSLNEYFYIEESKDKAEFFLLMQKGGLRQHTLGMYKDRVFYLLRLKNIPLLNKISDKDKPKEYNNLDISILNSIILRRIFGLDLEDKERIGFSHDADYIVSQVDKESSKIAFFLNSVGIEQLMAVARQLVRMPSKSTYFFPKVLSGLVINRFREA